jgi:autotransporter-associated beta strand protein
MIFERKPVARLATGYRRVLLASTALPVLTLAAVLLISAGPAFAAGGDGGGNPGSGGADGVTGNGGTGASGTALGQGGGGGGAGALGGPGGDAGAPGGLPGNHGNDAPPGSNDGGSGGGGGSHGSVGATLPVAPSTGTAGGHGGAGDGTGNGGGGGAGGFGAVVTGSGALGTLGVAATGGNGGAGGARAVGGNGGTGGIGLDFANGAGATFTVNASVSGGAGGAGGGAGGLAALGGAGIVGQNLSITMGAAGTVSGGSGANAITFNGGLNSLTFTNPTSGLTGNISVNGSLDFATLAGATTIANTITGAGAITKSGADTIILSGNNAYNGTTTVNAGTLSAGSTTGFSSHSAFTVNATLDLNGFNSTIASLAGAGTVTNSSGTAVRLTLGGGMATVFSGAILDGTGTTALTLGGNGTALTLSGGGQNTYSGATTVGDGTTISRLTGGATNAFSGNSALTVNATSAVDLGGFNQVIGSLAGAGTVTNLGGTAARLTAGGDNSSTTFSGVIADGTSATALIKTGTGTLTLTGTNTYTGGTGVTLGTLALTGTGSIANLLNVGAGAGTAIFDISGTTSGASIGSLIGATDGIVNLGSKTLTITNGAAGNPFLGVINGSGGLTVTGGDQVLQGINGYTGTTLINGGRVALSGTGSIAQSSRVTVGAGTAGTFDVAGTTSGASIMSLAGDSNGTVTLGSKTLTLTAANDTFAGTISGSGGLTLTGGTETITGSIGYNGATTINGGTLVVNSSLASSSGITVNAGGTLSGTGTVATTSVAGGTLAPGSGTPGSSMIVIGALGFTAASTYAVNINPTTSSFANATGTAMLGGATVNAIYASGSYVSKQYTILTAGVVSGHFGSLVNTNLPANFTPTLATDLTHAYLNLALNFTPSGPTAPGFGSGLNGNQQNVGNALTNFFNATGSIPLVFGALTPAGLSQVSGETATGSQQTTFNAMTQFMNVMTDPFIAGRSDTNGTPGGANGYADEAAQAYAAKRAPSDALAAIYTKVAPPSPFEARWSTWVAGYGGSQTTNGNAAAGSNNTTSSIAGTAVGADYRFSPFTIAGFALAGGGTSFSVAGGGSGHSDLFQAGAFVRHTVGAAYVSAALAYGWQDITSNRTVSVAGIDQLHAEFNANTFSGRVEGGYRFVSPFAGGVGITPYAAGQFTTFDLPAYAESVVSGAGNFALAYGAKSVTDARSEVGFRTDKSFAMSDSILTLRSRFAWAHDYNPDRSIGATFQTLPGASFVVNGAAQASDSVLTTASIERRWINNWSIAATFEGEFSNVTSSYAGKGVVRYQW